MLAARGRLTVSPNPMVGCIIVKNGRIVGEGWHRFAGDKHAEIHALDQAGVKARKADVYVTLEPCCHHGRTPPCVDALIAHGVARVIIADEDPNPVVGGRSVAILKQAGIEVIIGIARESAQALNNIFYHFHQQKRSYIFAKWAMSLDGRTTVNAGDDKRISNQWTQIEMHNLRNRVDAILVGSGTVNEDDPVLTVRLSEAQWIRQPLRVVVSAALNVDTKAAVWQCQNQKTLVFTTNKADVNTMAKLRCQGVECIVLEPDNDGQLDIKAVVVILAKRGVTSLLVEGGRRTHAAFFAAGIVDEIVTIVSPKLIFEFKQKQAAKVKAINSSADDCLINTTLN